MSSGQSMHQDYAVQWCTDISSRVLRLSKRVGFDSCSKA